MALCHHCSILHHSRMISPLSSMVENNFQLMWSGSLWPLAKPHITHPRWCIRTCIDKHQPFVWFSGLTCINQASVVPDTPVHVREILLDLLSKFQQFICSGFFELLCNNFISHIDLIPELLNRAQKRVWPHQEGWLYQTYVGHVGLHQSEHIFLVTLASQASRDALVLLNAISTVRHGWQGRMKVGPISTVIIEYVWHQILTLISLISWIPFEIQKSTLNSYLTKQMTGELACCLPHRSSGTGKHFARMDVQALALPSFES